MYFENLSVLLLVCFFSPGNPCILFSPITTIEGEYFSNCCPSASQDKGYAIKWYRENEGQRTLIQEDGRIVFSGTYLEFWPVALNDTGNYFCSFSYGTKTTNNTWHLKVLQKSKDSCFSPDHVTSHQLTVGEGYSLKCSDHITNAVSVKWYKDCIYERSQQWSFTRVSLKDAGNYTCVASFFHAGKIYNRTHTTVLKVGEDTEENAEPVIMGDDHVVVKTKIGEKKILNCTISDFSDNLVYWLHNKNPIEKCTASNNSIRICEMADHYENEGRNYLLNQLWINNVIEEDINSSFNCILTHTVVSSRTFVLVKDLNPDLSLHAFTTGMVMVIVFSFAAVFVAVLCVIFRVDIVLLYRDITQKDETLGDGKIYDAFVSYLKDCTPICGEERKFALEILPKALEENFGYKLCIFERDISPGGAVVDDVQSFIEQSRTLIIILSKNYISSKVMFELETGLHKALVERNIKVILIEYMPMSDFNFLPKSLELLSSSQVVSWNKEKSLPLNSRFWKKLRYAMPAKSSSTNAPANLQGIHPRSEQEQLVHSVSHDGWCP